MAEYRYNSLGQRVAKLTDQGFTTYLYGPDGQLLGESEYDATGSRQRSQSYLWLDSLPLASVQAQGSAPAKVLYLHSDHLNTPRLATSADQQVVWQWQSDAFGNGTANQDPQGSGQPTVLNLRFPGQYFDAESGLHYNYFRDYDPQTGRYVESDPIGLTAGLNTYGYVNANPISQSDIRGTAPDQVCLAMCTTVGAVAGGYVGTIAGGVVGGAGGTLLFPLGGTISGGVIGASSGGAAGALGGGLAGGAAGSAFCPEGECDPPAGTQCYEYNTGHKHKGMDPHYHVWQMNKSPNGCFWNKKRGLADTYGAQPSGMASCSSYPSWASQNGG